MPLRTLPPKCCVPQERCVLVQFGVRECKAYGLQAIPTAELLVQEERGIKADIYSLAMLALFLATSEHPWSSDTEGIGCPSEDGRQSYAEVVVRVLNGERPFEEIENVDDALLRTLILRCWVRVCMLVCVYACMRHNNACMRVLCVSVYMCVFERMRAFMHRRMRARRAPTQGTSDNSSNTMLFQTLRTFSTRAPPRPLLLARLRSPKALIRDILHPPSTAASPCTLDFDVHDVTGVPDVLNADALCLTSPLNLKHNRSHRLGLEKTQVLGAQTTVRRVCICGVRMMREARAADR